MSCRAAPLVAALVFVTSLAAPAGAHHAPRLFDNEQGDHGGSYEHGGHIFFWMPDEKRFDFLSVCLWPSGGFADRRCRTFEVRRVPAASFRPWGIQIRTDRYVEVTRGAWNLRFKHGHNVLSAALGFHRP
ncbi:MAG: hypothetical protein QOG54_2646 [Actinomycetota bacterium]|jgi:hypothetical protein|nr:hypothetical protein [Actinomycetota bacterium]